jgi:hypothetical protein
MPIEYDVTPVTAGATLRLAVVVMMMTAACETSVAPPPTTPASPVQAGRLIISASPTQISAPHPSVITVTVMDGDGKPVANVPVQFGLSDNTDQESFDSKDQPVFSDASGRAQNVLRTQSAGANRYQVTVKVQALFPGARTMAANVQVTVN